MVLTTVSTWTLKGAESFRIVEGTGEVIVRFPDGYPDPIRHFPTLQRALHTLGGIVPWECWTEETREALRAVNQGQSI